MWAKYVLFIGICAALVMSASVTVPYLSVWNSYNMESREMNVVAVRGEAIGEGLANTVANATLIAAYPKASINAYSNVFTLQLIFFVELETHVTSFHVSEEPVLFYSKDWNYSFIGYFPRHFQSDFRRYSSSGNIAPFFANYSMTLLSGRWPPIYASNPLYFAGTVQVSAKFVLNGEVYLDTDSYVRIAFLFDMEDYPVTVYCFNNPVTLWAAYAGSLIVGAAVSVNYFLVRKRSSESK